MMVILTNYFRSLSVGSFRFIDCERLRIRFDYGGLALLFSRVVISRVFKTGVQRS